MTGFDNAFGLTLGITWEQECARALVIFTYGLLAVRLSGRRIFARWSALDIVVSIVVGSNLSRALTGSAPLIGTILATTLLLALHGLLAQLAARSAWVSRWVEGAPIPLGRDGRPDPVALRTHGVSQIDLAEALRAAGLTTPAGARLLMLEPSGKISVLRDVR